MNGEDKEFAQIKSELITEIKGMRKDFDRAMVMIDTHEKALYGDRVKEPGAMEELRVLKTAEATRQRHIAWVWTAVVAGAVERVFHYITGR